MLIKVFFLLSIIINVNSQRKLVCYWLSGNIVGNIDPSLCTHLHFSFAILDSTSLLMKFESPTDVNVVNQINTLYPSLKVILSLGGGDDSVDGDKYSRLANSATARANFVQNSVQFLINNSFDGLDFDWEYPVCPNADCSAGPAYDKPNFATLLTALRAAFDAQTPKLSLSIAVNAGQWLADVAYNYTVLNNALDYINVMTYDNAGMWAGVTGHHSGYVWATNAMNWWATKVAKCKLLMGVPFYGVSFTTQNPNNHSIGTPVTASSSLTYLQICLNVKNNGWTKQLINTEGPIAYKGNQWVGYDDANRIMQKAQFVRDNGFGGIMIWEINQDDIGHTCCTTNRPLLRAANYGLFQTGSAPSTYGCP